MHCVYALILMVSGSHKDTLFTYYMNEIVVTEHLSNTPLEATIKEIPDSLIRETGLDAIHEILEVIPDIYVSIGRKNEANIYFRGFDQSQIAVLIDGLPVYVPYDGSFDFTELVSDILKKVKVSSSTGSVIYGPNTMGGVVNIITESPEKDKVNVKAALGRNMDKSVNLFASKRLGRLSFGMDGSYEKSDGYYISEDFIPDLNEDGRVRENSDYEKKVANLKVFYEPPAFGNIGLKLGVIDNVKGIPPEVGTTKPRYWRFTTWQKKTVKLMWTYDVKETEMRANAFYDTYYNVLDSYDDSTYTTQRARYAFHSTYDDYTVGSNLLTETKLPLINIRTGLHYKKDVHRAQDDYDEEWERYEMATYSFGVETDAKFTPKLTSTGGIGLSYMRPLYANGGDLRDPIFTYDPLFSIQYRAAAGTKLHLSFTGKTRFPTMKELYSEYLGRNVPNPDLKEERSFNFEFGITQVVAKKHQVSFVIYDSEIRDVIEDVVVDTVNDLEQLQNIGKARFAGVSLEVSGTVGRFDYHVSYSYLNAKDLEGKEILEDRPEQRGSIYFGYKLPYDVKGFVGINYTGSRYYYDRDVNDYLKLPDYTLVNLKLSKKIKFLELYFKVNNLLDVNYGRDKGFPCPGRYYEAGLNFSL